MSTNFGKQTIQKSNLFEKVWGIHAMDTLLVQETIFILIIILDLQKKHNNP